MRDRIIADSSSGSWGENLFSQRFPSEEGIEPECERPQVSVIIPFHNGSPLTRKCLSTLLPALSSVSAEILLVDNGSEDETAAWLKSLPTAIRILRNEQNLGFAHACNQGALASRGRYLLFLNNDTEVSPEWIAPLLKAIEQPGIGVIGCKLLYPDGTIQHAGIEMIQGVPDHPFRHAPADFPDANRPREMDMVTGACLLMPRKLFFPLLGFDEAFLNGVEDVDLCLRARMAGYRVFYEPRACALHREGQTPGRFQHARRNLNLFSRRWRDRFDARGVFRVDEPPRLIPASQSRLRASRLHLVWEGSQFAVHSLAKVNRELCRRILEEGHALAVLAPEHENEFPDDAPEWRWLAARRRKEGPQEADLWVSHQWPPRFQAPGAMPWVVIQPWEYGSLPRQWLAPLSNRVAEAWVPTRYVRDCYLQSGVPSDRVFVVPNGVDVACYRPGQVPYSLSTRKSFRFLFVGGTIWRKGIDILLDAYAQAFTSRDDVCLVIKDMGGESFYKGQTAKQRIQEFRSTPGNPEIEYLEAPIVREEEMAGLYAACHCLVHPYRGEGFGLPIAEAMACALPVIVTGYGAALDFCNEENAYLIPSRELRLPQKRIGDLETVDYPWVAEADRDALRSLMRYVIEHREEAAQKGKRAADFVSQHLSWETAADTALRRLETLARKGPEKSLAARGRKTTASLRSPSEQELSVVVIASKGFPSLQGCLKSLYDSNGGGFELRVLLLGGYPSGKIDPQRLAKRFPGCQTVCCERQLLAEVLDRTIADCRGRFVCLLLDEIRLLPGWFEGLREHLEALSEGGVCAPMLLGGDSARGAGSDSKTFTELAKRAEELRRLYRHRRIAADVPEVPCLLFERSLALREPISRTPATAQAPEVLRRWCAALTAVGYSNAVAGDVFVGTEHPGGGPRASLRAVSARAQAWRSFRKGDLEGAVARLVREILREPFGRANHLFLAEILLQAQRPRDALEILESLPPNPGDAVWNTLCGQAYRQLGGRDSAQQSAAEVLRQHADYAPAWRLAGLLAEDAGLRPQAKQAFAQAIHFDPSWGLPRTDLGRVLFAEGRPREALEEFEKAFILSPAEPEVSSAYFEMVSETDVPSRAEDLFREAVRLYPEDRKLRFLWIAYLLQREKNAAAMSEIEEAMAIFPLDEGLLQSALAVRKRVGPLGTQASGSAPARLSACLIAKNEEHHLPRALVSLRGLVDEIVVVDTGSTDRTREVAEALGARVFETAWNDDFAAARNVSLGQARGDWILVVDADEEIARRDHEVIRRLVSAPSKKKAAFRFVTRNYTDECGARGWAANDGSYPELEKGSGWFPSVKVRLFPRDPRIRFVYPVHEMVEPTIQKAGIPILDCDVPIHHYGRLDKARLKEKGKHYLALGMQKIGRLGEGETALRELASQAAGLEDYELALQLWERLLAGLSGDAAAWMNAGYAALRCGRFDQAIVHSRRALELDPEMREAALNLAAGHWGRGELTCTEEVLGRLLTNEKEYPPALFRMAALRLVQKRDEEAASLFRRLRALGFEPEGALNELASELRKGGRQDLARILLERANNALEASKSAPAAVPRPVGSPREGLFPAFS